MTKCGTCKALRATEAQVLRHGKTIKELIKLLQNAREDGGLTQVQCQTMDNLVAQNEAITAGLFSQELTSTGTGCE